MSIYAATPAVAAWLLVERNAMLVASLLLVQVVYTPTTPTTPITVGSLANAVVISDLVLDAVHLVTLLLILRKLGGGGGGRLSPDDRVFTSGLPCLQHATLTKRGEWTRRVGATIACAASIGCGQDDACHAPGMSRP